MISFEDACQRLERAAWRLGAERVSLAEALDRVLASDVHADADVPPFNKSSMDGYACRAADAIAPLRVIEHIPAGHVPARAITPGTCSKIMTGAPVPEGADCVLVVEEVEPCGEGLVRFTGGQVTRNICPAGEDVRAGDRVLSAGMRLRPQRLPVLASAGCARPEVYRRPRVAVLATGSELVPPDCAPGPGQIRDSNSTQIAALAREAGAAVTALGAAPDTPEALRAAWEGALAAHDVVISTGGVSMGDYDLVPGILADLGFTVHFDRVAIQPGKPVLFATRGEQACFGLSGNPVSSFLQFTLFAAPFLWRLQGESGDLARFPLLLGETFTRRNAARMGWVPVRLDDAGRARALEFHGSAHIHALTRADALIAYPPGADTLREGEIALAVLLRT
jgi:molybdopterin molybdotransferase